MNEITGSNPHSERAAGDCRISARVSHLLTVKVVSSDGRPLNPCHPARARELIRKQRAISICHHPFTIRLLSLSRDEAIRSQQEFS